MHEVRAAFLCVVRRYAPRCGLEVEFRPERLVEFADTRAAYDALDGCMQSLSGKKVEFNITGELDFLGERMAVANSNGVFASDESSIAWSHIACVIEGKKDVAGMHFDSSTHLSKLDPFDIGRNASEKALSSTEIFSGTFHSSSRTRRCS